MVVKSDYQDRYTALKKKYDILEESLTTAHKAEMKDIILKKDSSIHYYSQKYNEANNNCTIVKNKLFELLNIIKFCDLIDEPAKEKLFDSNMPDYYPSDAILRKKSAGEAATVIDAINRYKEKLDKKFEYEKGTLEYTYKNEIKRLNNFIDNQIDTSSKLYNKLSKKFNNFKLGAYIAGGVMCVIILLLVWGIVW